MIRLERLFVLGLFSLTVALVGCSQEIKIGALISETGGVGPYGQSVKRGIDLALEQINVEGGYKGPIQVIYRDDGSNPDLGKKALEELIDTERVRLVIGAISSSVTLAVAPICDDRHVVLLSPSSSAPEISAAGSYVFRNYPSDILEGTSMADFAKGQGLKRVAIIALSNEFGRGLTDVFRKQFESKSRMIVETFAIKEGDLASLASVVEQVKALAPEGIYVIAYVDEMRELLRLIREQGVQSVIMSSAAIMDDLLRIPDNAAENLVYAQPSFDIESDDPSVASFVKAYVAKYDSPPQIWAAHGYDALRLIVEAIKRTESAHPDEVKRGLLAITDYDGAAGRTTFDERGDVVRYPKLFIVQHGRPVAFEKFDQEGGKLPVPDR